MAFRPLAHYFFVRHLRDDFDLPNYELRGPQEPESRKEFV
jgi:hypothetical protein